MDSDDLPPIKQNESLNGTAASDGGIFRGEINVPSLVAVICFYALILGVGVFAYYRSNKINKGSSDTDATMLAGRNIGLLVGIFTMTATWVGGGYINGTAENVFTDGYGLAWTQGPWCFGSSLALNGFFFARKFRERNYVTMLDPIEERYGRLATSFFYLPALVGDVFWSAAILSALGGSLVVIVGLKHEWSIVISGSISVLYTLVGGLYSVALTDVVQISSVFIGLWLAAGFALVHPAVTPIGETAHAIFNSTGEWVGEGWLGNFPTDASLGRYIDKALVMIIGGIPWQVYYQRACSQKTPFRAEILSYTAAVGCVIAVIPAVLIGAVAKSADWNATEYRGPIPLPKEDHKLVLPLVLQFLTPLPVAVIGLGAISAAVMSSCDSSILASATMFSRNVYTAWRLECSTRSSKVKKPTSSETLWVMRICIVAIGALSCLLAIKVNSVYGLFYLSADLVYVLFFPTLLCSVYIEFVNTPGVLCGFVCGIVFRFLSGEDLLSFPPVIKFPYYDEECGIQLFPFKTLIMLINLSVTLLVSFLYNKWRGSDDEGNGDRDVKVEGESERMLAMTGIQDKSPS